MSSDPAPLSAVGEKVRIDTVARTDIPAYRRAVIGSRERIRPWNPVNPDDLSYHLGRQSDEHRTFLVRALPEHRRGDHDIVGKINLTGITRGRAFNGVLGYDSYDPYAGLGLFGEGLSLVVDVAFRGAPHGLGLNRVEAAVQPGNVRSAGLLRSIGFRRRGRFPNYLWLGDADGRDAWRDHVVYGVDRSEWRGDRYPEQLHDRPIVAVVGTSPQFSAPEVQAARELAVELGVPVLRGDGVDWSARLEDAVTGAVLLLSSGEGIPSSAHHVVDAGDLTTRSDVVAVALIVARLAHEGRPAAGVQGAEAVEVTRR